MRTLFALLLLSSCAAVPPGEQPPPDPPPEEEFLWDLPPGFPKPRVPADNPMTEAKVALGRRLFYDKNLSRNRTQSCASCHEQARAFTDGRQTALGSTGEAHHRNAQGLANVAYAPSLTWANPFLATLESQALVPFINRDPVELGFADGEAELLARLRADPVYPGLFAEAFPAEADPISMAGITRALASFQRVLISGDSPYDRFVFGGDAAALSEPAKRGMALFFSERLECNHCHAGFNFTDAVASELTPAPGQPFHNTGLYNLDGEGAYPALDPGLIALTGRPEDMGRFRAPSLRNVAVTAPYMHDGSIATLSEVIDHYAAGGRATLENSGVPSPLQSSFVRGFTLTAEEKADLLDFFESLTDPGFLSDPRFSDPFAGAP
jgi:cytochrome c peroxidase